MKFLIDECLHTSLVAVAHGAGHVCEHVNFAGLGGHKDWQLMTKIRTEDYTFVTNNRADFTALYAKEQLHAGLVIILPKRHAVPSAGTLSGRAVARRQAGSGKRRFGSGSCRRYRFL